MEVQIFLITVGLILAVVFIGIGVTIGRISEKHTETQPVRDSSDNDVRDRNTDMHNSNMGTYHEPVDCGQDLGLDPKAEEITIHLQIMRALASRTEKETIDYAIESVAIRSRLERLFEERGI